MACCRYFNPRFPQGKRPHDGPLPPRDVVISIHASRKGSDNPDIALNPDNVISIHASRKGSDVLRRQHHSRNRRFQSTLPAREATLEEISQIASDFDFNPRFPQGKRRMIPLPVIGPCSISIHASRKGSDSVICNFSVFHIEFQSTLPAREATLAILILVITTSPFQSTLPAREATFALLEVL